jgi:hypothetical protein
MDAAFIRAFHWHEFLRMTLLMFVAMLVMPVWRIFRKLPPRAPSPYVKRPPQSLVIAGLWFIWVLLLYVTWPSPVYLGIMVGTILTVPVENLLLSARQGNRVN